MYTPPEGIRLGPLEIRFYSVFILIGIFAGYYLAKPAAKLRRISADQLQISIFYGFIAGLIGARAYHVIDKWSLYSSHLADVFAIWNGGLAILGGLAGGTLGLWLFARQNKIRLLDLLDVWAPSLLLAQAIGRFGNWTNQEAFGPPTNLPWKIYIDPNHRPIQYATSQFFHPTFFYEAGWDFLSVIVLVLLRKRLAAKPGATLGLYFILYSVGRFWVESFRFGTAQTFGLATAQILAVVLFLLGTGLLVRAKPVSGRKPRRSASKS